MLTECSTCKKRYNDEDRSTICPHPPLGVNAEDYCEKCDVVRQYVGPCQHMVEDMTHRVNRGKPNTCRYCPTRIPENSLECSTCSEIPASHPFKQKHPDRITTDLCTGAMQVETSAERNPYQSQYKEANNAKG